LKDSEHRGLIAPGGYQKPPFLEIGPRLDAGLCPAYPYPHRFTPCKPEHGDTMKRTFDYVDNWLSDAKRFGTH